MSNAGHSLPEACSENSAEDLSPAYLPTAQDEANPASSPSRRKSQPYPAESQNKDDANSAFPNAPDQGTLPSISPSQQSPTASFPFGSLHRRDSFEEKEEIKKCLDPRPQPFGKEKNEVHRTPTFSPDLNSAKSHHIHAAQMFEDEGGGDGLASMESDEDVPLGYESLQELLADAEGVKIFREFLSKDEEHALDFWLACNGLSNHSEKDQKDLVTIIYKTYIKKDGTIRIDKPTRSLIKRKLEDDLELDIRVFDQAKSEVENALTQCAFRRFIKSEFYANWLLQPKQEYSDSSSPYETQGAVAASGGYLLPTVPENMECPPDLSNSGSLLTQKNLLATAKYRTINEKCRSDIERSYAPNPYCYPGYSSAVNVSLQDSERHSMSSGARTDDNLSCTSGSLEGFSHRRHARSSNQRNIDGSSYQHMLKNASLNKEPSGCAAVVANTSMTKKFTDKQSQLHVSNLAQSNPAKFASILYEQLLEFQNKKDHSNKLQQSNHRIANLAKEDSSEQFRREHAELSLPPNLLQQKLLQAEAYNQEDPTQILDDHVARVFDSPDHTPASPKSKSPPSRIKTPKFPHFHPGVQNLFSTKPPYAVKNSSKVGKNQPSIAHPLMTSGSIGYNQDLMVTSASSNSHSHMRSQLRSHSRRKERPQNSTFSIDSGNVSEYTLCHSKLPKSKSMPEYIENHGGPSDGGSSGSRPGSGNRRSMRHSCTETLVDSGISVVSDSVPSVGPSYVSADRINLWLAQSREACTSSNKGRCWTSHSIYPYADNECREFQKAHGNKSTHTMAGSTSPGTQRRNGGGLRSQSSSIVPGSACTHYSTGSLPSTGCHCYDQNMRDSPTKYSHSSAYERRKTRGAPTNSRLVKSSSHGDSSGSNGSSMKKQPKMRHGECSSPTISASVHGPSRLSQTSSIAGSYSGGSSQSGSESVVAVYSYADDEVPFTTKIPSREVTLRKFKQHLPKKGNYRFFFKKVCEEIGIVMDEVTDDGEVLPLFDGRIFAQIRQVEE